MFWPLQDHHILIYSYIYSIILTLMMWIFWIFHCLTCVSHVNYLLYIYGLYAFLLTFFISNCKFRDWIYEMCVCVCVCVCMYVCIMYLCIYLSSGRLYTKRIQIQQISSKMCICGIKIKYYQLQLVKMFKI